jgi:glycosidase
MSQLNGDEGAAKIAASILLTSPGVPFIYYGEEIGLMGRKPDENIRLPMQWTGHAPGAGFTEGTPWRSPGPAPGGGNVAQQAEDPGSLLSHYRNLIHMRNKHEALRIGDWKPVSAQPGRILAFLRQSDEETLLVLINPSRRVVEEFTLTLENGFAADGEVGAELLFGEGDVRPPTLNESGGFDEYEPLEVLSPQSTYIIQITSDH